MTPPFKTPGNASYVFWGFHSATTSPFFGKLRIRRPSGFAGPQPQHALLGAYFSCSDCESPGIRLSILRWSILSAIRGRTRIRAHLWPNVKGARPNETVVVVLFCHVRAPARNARRSEQRRV